jgi:hypothetical protein
LHHPKKLNERYVRMNRSELCLAVVLAEVVAIKFEAKRFRIFVWL